MEQLKFYRGLEANLPSSKDSNSLYITTDTGKLYQGDLQLAKCKIEDTELPQDWVDINNAYETFGEPGHKLMGGIIYMDFNGNIKVYPLSPAYGVRTDECGKKLAAVAVYNTAQQLMVKPATDGRHTVSLRQLDEFFGGGSTSDLGEKAFSLQKIPPVDLTPPINERKPYVFCRDTQNHFAPKYYGEVADGDSLAERDAEGRLRANAPDSGSLIYDDHLVNIEYLNRRLSRKYWICTINSYEYYEIPQNCRSGLLMFELLRRSTGESINIGTLRYRSNTKTAVHTSITYDMADPDIVGYIKEMHLYNGLVQFYGYVTIDECNSSNNNYSSLGYDMTTYFSGQYDLYCYHLGDFTS